MEMEVTYINIISERFRRRADFPSKSYFTKRFIFTLKAFSSHAVLLDGVDLVRRKAEQRNSAEQIRDLKKKLPIISNIPDNCPERDAHKG